jgi:hypothetical protein
MKMVKTQRRLILLVCFVHVPEAEDDYSVVWRSTKARLPCVRVHGKAKKLVPKERREGLSYAAIPASKTYAAVTKPEIGQ